MEILRDAAHAVQRNLSALIQYLAFSAGYSLLMSGLSVYVHLRFGLEDASMPRNVVMLAGLLVGTAWMAAAQTLVFTRMGREIDKPLWKVRDAAEGFRRFYMLWFEFNLVLHTLSWVLLLNVDSQVFGAFKLLAFIGFLSGAIVLIPFGACVMFHGRFSWESLGESLAPLAKQFPKALPIFVITFLQVYLGIYIGLQLEAGAAEPSFLNLATAIRLGTDVALGYLDCLAFAATWVLCIVDRESPDEIDLDF